MSKITKAQERKLLRRIDRLGKRIKLLEKLYEKDLVAYLKKKVSK